MGSTTALLLFNRTAAGESRHKGITGHQAYNPDYQAFKALNEHTLAIARKSGLPVFPVDEHQQIGDNFGERFTHAYEQLFKAGFEQVIAIGNDHPGLTVGHIQDAYEGLAHYDHVLGPATDGGFYLMGLHRHAFRALDFQNLPWQTSGLQQAYARVCAAFKHATLKLDPLQDIDSPADLRALRVPYCFSDAGKRLATWLKSLILPPFLGRRIPAAVGLSAILPRTFDARGPPPHIQL